ncbi:MAG: hypothetical protein GWP15_02325 [Nitrospirae bacterium]|nr:hypothetical protein [Nitrospirota bacterium]
MTKTITPLKVTDVTNDMVREGLGSLLKQTKGNIWTITHNQFSRILWANLPMGDNKSFRARIDAMVAIPDIYIGITNDEEIFLYIGDITSLLPTVIERNWILITDADIGIFEDTSTLLATYATGDIYTGGMTQTATRIFDLLTIGLTITDVRRWFAIDEKTRNLIGDRHIYTYCGGETALANLHSDVKPIASFRMIPKTDDTVRKNAVRITDTSGDIIDGTVNLDGTNLQFTWSAVSKNTADTAPAHLN